MILTSKWLAEHLLAGRNTQQPSVLSFLCRPENGKRKNEDLPEEFVNPQSGSQVCLSLHHDTSTIHYMILNYMILYSNLKYTFLAKNKSQNVVVTVRKIWSQVPGGSKRFIHINTE